MKHMVRIFSLILLASIPTLHTGALPGNHKPQKKEQRQEKQHKRNERERHCRNDNHDRHCDNEQEHHRGDHREHRCEVDYIVVGGGTAGSVVGRMLSDNFSNEVIILERGQNHMNDPKVLSCNLADSNTVVVNPTFSETFAGFDTPDRFQLVGTGRMLGGGGAHNRLLEVWGQQPFDQWATISGNPRWSLANVLPLLKANETFIPFTAPASPLRGTNGPLVLTQNAPVDNLAIAQNAAAILLAPLVSDYNTADLATSTLQNFCEPVGTTSQRTFSARAYLNEVINPDGTSRGRRHLTVKLGAQATRIIFGGKCGTKAIGIEYILDGCKEEVHRIFARKEIILSLGAIHTPQLLLLSGVGPSAQLKQFKIPVVQENNHVGAHFKYQYGVTGIYTGGYNSSLPVTSFFNGASPFATTRDSQMLIFPTLEGEGSIAGPSFCLATTRGAAILNAPLASMYAWNNSPRSEGTVQLADNNPLTEPLVDFNTYSDGDLTDPNSDASKAVRYFRLMRIIAQSINEDMAFPLIPHFGTDIRLFQDALIGLTITNNYTSTCRMSQVADGPGGGVVDGNLRVHGIKNLRIADLSIVPSDFLPQGKTSIAANIIGIVAAQILGATSIP